MFFQMCGQFTECSRDIHSASRSHGLLKNAHLACILGFKGFKVCNALTMKWTSKESNQCAGIWTKYQWAWKDNLPWCSFIGITVKSDHRDVEVFCPSDSHLSIWKNFNSSISTTDSIRFQEWWRSYSLNRQDLVISFWVLQVISQV